ncbi:hypothetical protein SDC9_114230 [bioreactor metagenome]|uniref:ABM domain-containing protein n=1 Tax=bioreactor metagenome TaxID=1076179 RepID=A0A645BQC3_9ZZZZ
MDAFIALASRLVEATRRHDAGCIRYELLQEIGDPQILTFYEEWEDQEALNRHLDAPHCKEIAPGFAELMEGPRDLAFYKKLI